MWICCRTQETIEVSAAWASQERFVRTYSKAILGKKISHESTNVVSSTICHYHAHDQHTQLATPTKIRRTIYFHVFEEKSTPAILLRYRNNLMFSNV